MKTPLSSTFFFFNDTATTEIYTLSLHDALPICQRVPVEMPTAVVQVEPVLKGGVVLLELVATAHDVEIGMPIRSEEHTSELQSQSNLVCRLLLEKKKTNLHNANINCARSLYLSL